MTQTEDRPAVAPEPIEHELGGDVSRPPRRPPPSPARAAATIALLATVTLTAAAIGYVLAGGRLPGHSQSAASAPGAAVTTAPAEPTTVPAVATATSPPVVAAAPTPASAAPTPPPVPPTAAPTVAPTAAATATAIPVTPTSPPQPTAPPQATAPATTAPAATPPAVAKPAAAQPDARQGVAVPIRVGTDARKAQIEGRVNEYFDAVAAGDFARAQAVCCTPAWRARYPLERWRHNFDGVTGLDLAGPPRYVRVEDDIVVVDSDYTFISGGVRRAYTVRWTFRPVGTDWLADLAEATPAQ